MSPVIDAPVMAEDRIILPEDVPEPVLSAAPQADIPAGVPGPDAPAPKHRPPPLLLRHQRLYSHRLNRNPSFLSLTPEPRIRQTRCAGNR